MPYIPQEKRPPIDRVIDDLHHVLVGLESDDENNNMEGNLNYLITRLLRKIYGTSYAEINAAIGMLNCVALEHYRTMAAPYEDQKKFENGDVEPENVSIHLDEVVVEKPVATTWLVETDPWGLVKNAGQVDMNPKLQHGASVIGDSTFTHDD